MLQEAHFAFVAREPDGLVVVQALHDKPVGRHLLVIGPSAAPDRDDFKSIGGNVATGSGHAPIDDAIERAHTQEQVLTSTAESRVTLVTYPPQHRLEPTGRRKHCQPVAGQIHEQHRGQSRCRSLRVDRPCENYRDREAPRIAVSGIGLE
jgi:hypothetical protein